jgi:lysophospholipase L1-like esterase
MMRRKIFILILFLYGYQPTAKAINKIKIACLGASITYGSNLSDREQNAYPQQLQKMLGNGYEVSNYGVSSTTLLSHGDFPYRKTNACQAALQSQPDIVFIDLGGNDSKLINRVYEKDFENDYHLLIQSFVTLTTHPRIILLLPIPSFIQDTTQIWDPAIVSIIIPHIRQVAFNHQCEVIDMHSLFMDKESWMPDKIHPNEQGAALTAKRLYDCVIQNKDWHFDIFNQMTSTQMKISSFYGYNCADFIFDSADCKIVKPKWTAAGRPWVWRARFWGHEPQTDIALLERGYHIVYCDVAELFGNEEAISRWNHFYSFLKEKGLAEKAIMEGMSRGAVYVFNWAAVNPGKVSGVYVDNPVLDLKSWPAGLGKVPPSKVELELLKKDYRLTDTTEIRKFKGSPVDKVEQIVRGKYPILILCADADEAVPPEENTVLFEQKIKEKHGDITVMHKRGFKHHPHSLPNPTPIVEFILKASGLLVTE